MTLIMCYEIDNNTQPSTHGTDSCCPVSFYTEGAGHLAKISSQSLPVAARKMSSHHTRLCRNESTCSLVAIPTPVKTLTISETNHVLSVATPASIAPSVNAHILRVHHSNQSSRPLCSFCFNLVDWQTVRTGPTPARRRNSAK